MSHSADLFIHSLKRDAFIDNGPCDFGWGCYKHFPVGVELFSHMVREYLTFKKLALFSIMAVRFFVPTSSV